MFKHFFQRIKSHLSPQHSKSTPTPPTASHLVSGITASHKKSRGWASPAEHVSSHMAKPTCNGTLKTLVSISYKRDNWPLLDASCIYPWLSHWGSVVPQTQPSTSVSPWGQGLTGSQQCGCAEPHSSPGKGSQQLSQHSAFLQHSYFCLCPSTWADKPNARGAGMKKAICPPLSLQDNRTLTAISCKVSSAFQWQSPLTPLILS